MASTYLSKGSWGTPTADTKFTISLWFKICDAPNDESIIFNSYTGSSDRLSFSIDNSRRLKIENNNGSYTLRFITNRVIRDPNAFYHVVCKVDTTQGTESERFKMYVNGVQETSFNTATYPSHSAGMKVPQSGKTLYIGAWTTSGQHWNGIMSHFHFTDGYAYDASSFGETDSTTGEWKIKTDVSVTYGTNGFFILKDGNSLTDQSPNTNNFTVGGGTLTKTEDNPSNVFATWNSIGANLDTTLTNGNTKVAHGSQLERRPVISALGMSSGKYYAEFKALSGSAGNIEVGIVNRSDPTTQGRYMGQALQDAGFIAYKFDGVITFDGTDTTGLTTTATNDIIGVAVDIDNTKVYFYKNGVLINSGGTSFANMQGGDGDYFFCNGDRSGSSTYSLEANFGNGYFGTTAVASAGTNASGIGIFEYDVPTGYTALSTKGLNL